MKAKDTCSIGKVARRTKLSVHAVRYYEKLGLIHKPARTEGGFRLYGQDSIEKILFIKKAQTFGLSLDEIRKIMCCSDRGLEPCCALMTRMLSGKIREFEAKIKELQAMKRRLKKLVRNWRTA